LQTAELYFDALLALKGVPPDQLNLPLMRFLSVCGKNLSMSQSQLFQDIFAIFCHNGKKNGFFVEFGATDGVSLSNTYVLEKHFAWQGILAEPAKRWHSSLKSNRSAAIDTRCVWTTSKQLLPFVEADIGELSTLTQFESSDSHTDSRKTGKRYDVETVSLNDLLHTHNCPQVIDYMSVDTEGSEFEILSNLDFNRYRVGVFTIEHSYTPKREDIRRLLTSKGYLNIFEAVSKWDDWFVHKSMFNPSP
jgi:FkbM family methyltransferase